MDDQLGFGHHNPIPSIARSQSQLRLALVRLVFGGGEIHGVNHLFSAIQHLATDFVSLE